MRTLLAVVAVSILTVLSGCSTDEPRDLTVRSLSVVDSSGTVRAEIDVTDSGATVLRLYDGSGQGRLETLITNSMAAFGLFGEGDDPPSVTFTVMQGSGTATLAGDDPHITFSGEQMVILP